MVDLAKKVHNLRIKWDIPQFCHQQDEIKGLYAQDDGFLGLQVITNIFTQVLEITKLSRIIVRYLVKNEATL